jgi:hypothetical protein
MAGYYGKPLTQKLGIQPGFCIFVEGAPAAYANIVGQLPDDVKIASRLKAPLDMVHVFATEEASLGKRLFASRAAIAPDGMIWVSWPKKASGVATDVTENVVRATALALGLVDIKVCAVDDIWSGLKFVIPKSQRNGGRRSRDQQTRADRGSSVRNDPVAGPLARDLLEKICQSPFSRSGAADVRSLERPARSRHPGCRPAAL